VFRDRTFLDAKAMPGNLRRQNRQRNSEPEGGLVAADDSLLVPVGHDLGVLYQGPEPEQRRQVIRVSGDIVELDDNEFAIWLLAHGIDDQDRPTRASLVATARRLGLPAATIDEAISRFLTVGSLVSVQPASDSAVAFAQQHQLIPLMLGLGPDKAHLEELEPRRVLTGLLNSVHGLLSVRAAYFDRRRFRRTARCSRSGITRTGRCPAGAVGRSAVPDRARLRLSRCGGRRLSCLLTWMRR
jgi:hypothetical protein